ncbi:hypothetical protein GIB67_010224 [Kingdonia uniflora]|uniref:Senescence domain-containing protein n=1 Tax=Kingdonia uniflora TaxID=39325 RepID=A0A7J7NB27_9MAGN|nr:hypothetical protein GIB67_010224 [Kingdonia uniflora]
MSCFSGCCGSHRDRSLHQTISSEAAFPSDPEARKPKEEILLRIPGCKVHLVQQDDTVELAKGDFTVFKLVDDNISLATVIKVGEDLQWPLTKDEPVVKLDALQYLFSLPMKDRDLLNYGISFSEQSKNDLVLLDSFLKEHSCFSIMSSSNARGMVNWRDFAPRIEDYNGALGKAIAGGTGEIVKGIFKCSNAYTKQVQKGGEVIITQAAEEKNNTSAIECNNNNKGADATKKSGVNKGLKRARKLSKMTEKISKSLLNGVGIATGSVVRPVVRSQTGKTILAMVPGEVLLATLDAVNKILDAVEVAEKQTLSATSGAATRIVSNRFGENAGEATDHVLATAGHCAGTAWNIFKIRRAINPASSLRSSIVKNVVKKKTL